MLSFSRQLFFPFSFVLSRTNLQIMRKLIFFLAFAGFAFLSNAQQKKNTAAPPKVSPGADSVLLTKVKYRLLGPWRGGRSAAATGSYKSRNTFFFGSTGGGVWKSSDGGNN
jgi:hypothetical protein